MGEDGGVSAKIIFPVKICVLIFLFLCPVTVYSEIYKWVDDKGEVHFTISY